MLSRPRLGLLSGSDSSAFDRLDSDVFRGGQREERKKGNRTGIDSFGFRLYEGKE